MKVLASTLLALLIWSTHSSQQLQHDGSASIINRSQPIIDQVPSSTEDLVMDPLTTRVMQDSQPRLKLTGAKSDGVRLRTNDREVEQFAGEPGLSLRGNSTSPSHVDLPSGGNPSRSWNLLSDESSLLNSYTRPSESLSMKYGSLHNELLFPSTFPPPGGEYPAVYHPVETAMNASLLGNGDLSRVNHVNVLTGTMRNISHALRSLGLVGQCSPLKKTYLMDLVEEMIPHLLIAHNTKRVNEVDVRKSQWTDGTHPVNKLQRKLSSSFSAQKKLEFCKHDAKDEMMFSKTIERVVGSLDGDLVEYLSLNALPAISVLNEFHEYILIIEPLSRYICQHVFGASGLELTLCVTSMKHLSRSIEPFVTSPRLRQQRIKRYSETQDRDGWDQYKEDSPSDIIVIQNSVDSFSQEEKQKAIKLIGALTIGTYAIVGVLGLQTIAAAVLSQFSRGPPGPPGDDGPAGDLGMEGIKGPKGAMGVKGIKGLGGMLGMVGMDGMEGAQGGPGMPGMSGMQGQMGSIGMDGMDGERGMKGNPGDTGDDGMMGGPGEDGEQGEKGDVPGNGRRKRRRSIRGVDLLDSPELLKLLFQNREGLSVPSQATFEGQEVIEALNRVWRENRDQDGCVRCHLFKVLQRQPSASLDHFTVAAFSQVLGHPDSLQLLSDVMEARRRGTQLSCLPTGGTCTLQLLSSPLSPPE